MADTPPADGTLQQAIDEATRVLCKANRVPDGDVLVRDKRKDAEALAEAGLLAVPAPAVDQERLTDAHGTDAGLLLRAAEHARQALPRPLGRDLAGVLEIEHHWYPEDDGSGDWLAYANLARAVLALPVPAPAVDREGLIRLIADASNRNPFPEAEDIADTLIDVGIVRVADAAEEAPRD